MHIVIVSGTNRGMTYYGPFPTKAKADEYADMQRAKADDGIYIQIRELMEPRQ